MHLASKVECKLQEDSKKNRATSFMPRATSSGRKFVAQFNVGRGIISSLGGGSQSHAQATTHRSEMAAQKEKIQAASSATTSSVPLLRLGEPNVLLVRVVHT